MEEPRNQRRREPAARPQKTTVHRRRKSAAPHTSRTAPSTPQAQSPLPRPRPSTQADPSSHSRSSTQANPSPRPRPSAQATAAPSKAPRIIALAVAVLAALALAAAAIWGATKLLTPPNPTEPFSAKLAGATETVDDNGIVHGVSADSIAYTLRGRQVAGATEGVVTFAAVGDQIGSDEALEIADKYQGKKNDDAYDFTPFYQEVQPFLTNYDLKFINQETITNTSKGWAVNGWPTFNSPDSVIDAIDEVGFNLVSFCSNHVYDLWTDGIDSTHEVFASHPNLLVAGSYPTQEARDTVQLVERNGITFALLAYGYGSNGYDPSDMPDDYHLVLFDEDTAEADIARAHQVADVVIVYMHWGTEYDPTVTHTQDMQAQFLADQGVDLVLGSHNHVTQTIRMYDGPEGKTVPVVFGMSDFVSGYRLVDTIVSGIFTCDFVKGEDEVSIRNMRWYPCVEWSDGGDTYVRMIKDMTDEELNANTRPTDCKKQARYIRGYINDLQMEVPVIMTPEDEEALESSKDEEA